MKYYPATLACMFFMLASITACTHREPAFVLKGDPAIIKDVKVNVQLTKDNSSVLATAFYNGDSYDIDNQDILRYDIYISYKDSLFYQTEMDNLHGRVSGLALNELRITSSGDSVMVTYKPLETPDVIKPGVLLPATVFFANDDNKVIEKQKFTSLYNKK